jgi:hypothetical protein
VTAMKTTRPRALLVHESMFGNTAQVAEAVARGLELAGWDVSRFDVADAPTGSLETEVVVVGAPTHGLSLSRPNSREDAVRKGADPAHVGTGVREWIDTLPSHVTGQLAATFDTRVRKVRRLPAAAPKIARELRKRGFALVEDPTGFCVDDVAGPLCAEERERATAWGRQVALAAGHQVARAGRESP